MQPVLRKYGEAAVITFDLFEIDGIDFRVDALHAAGDTTIMIDEAVEINTTNGFVDEGNGYSITLTATEMQAARIVIYCVDQGTKAWLDRSIVIESYGNAAAQHAFDLDTASVPQTADHTAGIEDIPTVTEFNARTLAAVDYFDPAADDVAVVTTLTNKTGFSLSATGLDLITATATGVVEIAKAVWDRVLTGGTHNINNSAGKRLRGVSGIIFSDGTAQSGGANSIQLASGAITTDDMFVRAKVIIVGGTGSGQEAIITDSVASTDTLTITPAWLVNPDATSEYEVLPAQAHATVRNGGYDNGFVYVDLANGSAGTVKGVNGTSTNKSSVLADARAIADQETIRRFDIEGGTAFSLDQSYTDWVFDHVSASFIDLNSQDVTGAVFLRSGITGVGTNTGLTSFEICGLTNVTIGRMSAIECAFEGTLTLANTGQHLALRCSQNGSAVPVLDVNGDGITETGMQLSDYKGTLDIRGMTSVDTVVITGDAHVSINADCTGGTITYAGDVKITDNAGGAVTELPGLISDIKNDTAEIGVEGVGLVNLGGMSTVMQAEILAEVNTALDTAIAELGVGVPSATPTVRTALILQYMALRNQLVVQTSGTDAIEIRNDAGTLITQKTITDDGSDYTEAKMS